MFIKFSDFKKGIIGTLFLIFLIPVSNLLVVNFPFQNNFINKIAPIYFLIFLFNPYLNRTSSLIGGFLGFIAFSIIISLPFQLAVPFSIVSSIILYFQNSLFYREPEKTRHLILNIISCALFVAFYGWLSAITSSLANFSSFLLSFQAYFYFGLISTMIIVPTMTYLYGLKLHSNTMWLRK
jgi:hypothetical protein